MRTPDEIAAELADTIRHIYARPSMYARPDNIESTLWNFHWAWAIVYETEQLFRDTHIAKLREFDAASGLVSRFKGDNPDASDDDAQTFAFQHWREISAAMNVPLDS
ncbi:hypothetical protein Poly51_39730 [Rubripirellula tenax]|uniref:Uncharacterized protein n=1 Tax=Rubripirellula tenax TaxID=2528015 RepID=A0A5C6EQW4_9BACT|nr:hypothetical protein [Rubripirellula tenax]TWU50680.1 hypothetical protein Poly51_39730 [Rubripirellula tenax]